MELSAKNQLKGTVKSVKLGDVMAEVAVNVGTVDIVAAITRSSADRLALAEGSSVVAIIKATDVIVATE
jgi:molybdopterin-binding protein